MISQCSLCENFKGKRKHGLFLFPFEIDKTYQSHFMQKIVQKLIYLHQDSVFQTTNFQLFDNKEIICDVCWQLIQQGFVCRKCYSQNFVNDFMHKQCQFCKYYQCVKCNNSIEIFSNEQSICYSCKKQELIAYKLAFIIMIIIVGLFLPYLSINYLITKFFDPTRQYGFCKENFFYNLGLFILFFPFLFPYTIIELMILGVKTLLRNLK